MSFGDSDCKLSWAVEIVATSEGEGGFDVGREFGKVEFAVVGLEDFLDPGAGLVNAELFCGSGLRPAVPHRSRRQRLRRDLRASGDRA